MAQTSPKKKAIVSSKKSSKLKADSSKLSHDASEPKKSVLHASYSKGA